ncbi:MAG: hypothetical protein ACFFA2_01320 [Promethearchaeota archaeon]
MVRKNFFVIYILIGIVLGATIPTLFIYRISNDLSGSYRITTNISETDISEVQIYNEIPVGNIKFIPVSSETTIIKAEWAMSYVGIYDPQKIIVTTCEIIQSRLVFSIYSKIDKLAFINSILTLDITIFFNPSYGVYGFVSDSEKANIDLLVYNLNFSKFDFKSSSGNINIRLDYINMFDDFKITTSSGDIYLIIDHTYFAKDFICTTSSGYQNFDFWNIGFDGKANFLVTSNTGRIYILWANHYLKSHSLNVKFESNNDIYLKFWSPKEIIRSYFSFETIDGTTRFSKPSGIFQEVDENHYIAYNINDTSADPCNITIISKHGYGWVFYVDCFKWQRFCTYGDIKISYVTKSGSYSISETSYNITAVDFSNKKYVYLNTYRLLPLKIEPLPVSSENLIYVVWNLKYLRGQNIGVGSISLSLSHKQNGDNLEVNLRLSFIIDEIKPTFSICNITLFYHPSYNFNNYTI